MRIMLKFIQKSNLWIKKAQTFNNQSINLLSKDFLSSTVAFQPPTPSSERSLPPDKPPNIIRLVKYIYWSVYWIFKETFIFTIHIQFWHTVSFAHGLYIVNVAASALCCFEEICSFELMQFSWSKKSLIGWHGKIKILNVIHFFKKKIEGGMCFTSKSLVAMQKGKEAGRESCIWCESASVLINLIQDVTLHYKEKKKKKKETSWKKNLIQTGSCLAKL